MPAITYRGVLIPAELREAPTSKLDEYVEAVKVNSRAFVRAYFALEDRAAELGLTLEELDS